MKNLIKEMEETLKEGEEEQLTAAEKDSKLIKKMKKRKRIKSIRSKRSGRDYPIVYRVVNTGKGPRLVIEEGTPIHWRDLDLIQSNTNGEYYVDVDSIDFDNEFTVIYK